MQAILISILIGRTGTPSAIDLFRRAFCLVLSIVETLDSYLLIKPNDTVISRDQHTPFSALCSGHESARVGESHADR